MACKLCETKQIISALFFGNTLFPLLLSCVIIFKKHPCRSHFPVNSLWHKVREWDVIIHVVLHLFNYSKKTLLTAVLDAGTWLTQWGLELSGDLQYSSSLDLLCLHWSRINLRHYTSHLLHIGSLECSISMQESSVSTETNVNIIVVNFSTLGCCKEQNSFVKH